MLSNSVQELARRFSPALGWQKIQHAIFDISSCNAFYHIVTLIQSSGFGKTKACFDLMRNNRAVYFPCSKHSRATNQPGVFRSIVEYFKKACKQEKGDLFAERLIAALQLTASSYATVDDLYEAQVSHSQEFCESLLSHVIHTLTTPTQRTVRLAENLSESHETNRFETEPASTSKRFKKCYSDANLIIIFDDLQELVDTGESYEPHSHPVRCLSRAINKLKTVFGVYASTTSQLPSLMPGHYGSGWADRRTFYEPICQIFLCDQFAGVEKDHPFFFGRPMWYTTWRNYSENLPLNKMIIPGDQPNTFEHLVAHASDKLLAYVRRSNIDKRLVIFAVRFCLGVSHVVSNDLISRHLATLGKIEW